MCGIVGIVAPPGEAADRRALQGMNDRIAHRGPDGEGFMLASGEHGRLRHEFFRRADGDGYETPVRVGLGHRRLAILDLSDRGLQPMTTADGRTWIVFNGEIYNHREIQAELRSRGYVFTSRTDTEVLLNAYVEWGAGCADRLEGMYAFAIWDGTAGTLFCARDRLGIKPFYYSMTRGYFIFASEIKALTSFPGFVAAADDEAAVGFLAHGNCDYGDRTIFRGVQALPPAHTLTVDAGTGRCSITRYWTPVTAATRAATDEDRVKDVRSALIDTVRKHLISDVRAGSCLSGGLDSSAVVSVIGRIRRDDPGAAAATGDELYTFTSCYENKEFDERQYALSVAQAHGARPHLVFPLPDNFWSDFEKIAWHQDMPFGGLSYYAQWRVMRAAREAGVKVLLDGQGGDEVFGGYAKFRYAYIASLLRQRRVKTLTRELVGMIRHGDRYFLDLRNGVRYLPPQLRRGLRVDSALQHVLIPDWNAAVGDESTPATRWWRNFRTSAADSPLTLLQRIQVDDLFIDTLPQLLRMEDRSSMAFSLEARVPLLDHKIVELGLSLPDHLKVNGGWSKFAIRQAMVGLIPEYARLRKTKLGFAAPDREWLGGALRNHITELLSGDLRCARYVDVTRLRQWYRQQGATQANTGSYCGLFRILSLEMWMRAFSLS